MLATPAMLAQQYVHALMDAEGLSSFDGLRILDFGAGHGLVSRELSARGADVVALDPFGADEWRIDEVPIYSSKAQLVADRAWTGTFDGVIMVEVLEHLTSPSRILSDIREGLKDQGWFFVTTPNAGAARARLEGSSWQGYAKAGHLILYTPRSVRILLGSCSFGDVKFIRSPVRFTENNPRHFVQALLQWMLLGGNLKAIAKASGG